MLIPDRVHTENDSLSRIFHSVTQLLIVVL